MHNYYYLIHPRGDRKVVKVLELSAAMDYEIHDYARAREEPFLDEDDANEHGKNLAQRHGLLFQDQHGQSPYLDDGYSP